MSQHEQSGILGPNPGNSFLHAMVPLTRTASLLSELSQNYLQMYAATTSLALRQMSARQSEALRAINAAALLACWPQFYLASSFGRAFSTPLAMTPLPGKPFANGSLHGPMASGQPVTFAPGRRSSAVVIDFPERRKAGR